VRQPVRTAGRWRVWAISTGSVDKFVGKQRASRAERHFRCRVDRVLKILAMKNTVKSTACANVSVS
jgi:hypothetical protein